MLPRASLLWHTRKVGNMLCPKTCITRLQKSYVIYDTYSSVVYLTLVRICIYIFAKVGLIWPHRQPSLQRISPWRPRPSSRREPMEARYWIGLQECCPSLTLAFSSNSCHIFPIACCNEILMNSMRVVEVTLPWQYLQSCSLGWLPLPPPFFHLSEHNKVENKIKN